jgi:hypothetical protein
MIVVFVKDRIKVLIIIEMLTDISIRLLLNLERKTNYVQYSAS